MKATILTTATVVLIATSSCVSPKVYNDLERRYADLEAENKTLSERNTLLDSTSILNTNAKQKFKDDYLDAIAQRDKYRNNYIASKTNYDNLKLAYDTMVKNSSSSLEESHQNNRELTAKLVAKEQVLAAESDRLEQLKTALNQRSQRVTELENIINSKDIEMQQLKETISSALINFKGNGLTVEQREGKVYVSMENKLLFKSGSWSVQKNGKYALEQLAAVLANNPDIAVLIEGHTDNVPFKGKGQVKDNWDLSTKRATAIVHILEDYPNIISSNLTAAGRGEYAPIASNDSETGKAKNRRIEVVLTPKLDKIAQLLNAK